MSLELIPLFSGSSGNAIFLGNERTRILIDAGMTGAQIEYALAAQCIDPSSLNAILVTHEHIDHIRSVGVLSRKYGIPVYANALTWIAMRDKVGDISLKNEREIEDSFFVGDVDVQCISIPHDAAAPLAFRFFCGRVSVSVVTDLGYCPKRVFNAICGSDVVLLESNHDVEMLRASRYPQVLKRRILSNSGHLSNDVASAVAVGLIEKGTRAVILGHLSEENNSERLAYSVTNEAIQSAGIEEGAYTLGVAHRDRPSERRAMK